MCESAGFLTDGYIVDTVRVTNDYSRPLSRFVMSVNGLPFFSREEQYPLWTRELEFVALALLSRFDELIESVEVHKEIRWPGLMA